MSEREQPFDGTPAAVVIAAILEVCVICGEPLGNDYCIVHAHLRRGGEQIVNMCLNCARELEKWADEMGKPLQVVDPNGQPDTLGEERG